MMGAGMSMAQVTGIAQLPFIRFDSYLLFAEYTHIGNLLLTYLLFLIPFFLGALAIGLVFVNYVDTIGKIYFADLLGSGLGGLLALALTWYFFPEQLPALISILPVLSGILLIPVKKGCWQNDKTNDTHSGFRPSLLFYIVFAAVATGISIWKMLSPPQLILSQYKDLSKTLLLPEAVIQEEKASPYGLIQIVTSPVLRYAPGLSLAARQTAKVNAAVFTNGDWFGAVSSRGEHGASMVLDYTTFAFPYILADRKKVLVLQAGTGMNIAHALSRGAEKVIAVEPNKKIVSLLKKEWANANDSLFYHPYVSVHTVEPRTFLSLDTAHYDLISLPVVGTFGGSSGLYALHEQFLLTKESFHEMWLRLNRGGVICVTSWMDYPVRNPLKILATLIEVAGELNLKNVHHHIAAVRSWGTITFVLTRSPLTGHEINNTRRFCEEMMFDPALLPGLKLEERNFYNQFEDNRFFAEADQLFSEKRKDLYADYDFNIQPATDNRPYFSQFIRWKSLGRLSGFFGNRSLPFFEIGYVLVVVTLLQITVVSFILILLPLFKTGWKGKGRFWIVLYFGGIGLGYMFVEMVLIQRFILYFGNPVYAASIVITSLLVFSGLGSYTSGHFMQKRKSMLMIFAAIVLLLFIYSFTLTSVLQYTVRVSLPLKSGILILLTAPLAFCMGMPFPAGLYQISKTSGQEIPWAWGINGCLSVISTALATIVSVEAGFIAVLLLASLAYCLPLATWVAWAWQKQG
jgi:spermidine synthase